MKNVFILFFAALLCAACDAPATLNDVADGDGVVEDVATKSKKFTFTVKGDFAAPTFSRGYLSADGKEMTDLWVFDYVDGVCVQQLHQSVTDEDWGKPKMSLTLGNHSVYFVASRGSGAVVDMTNHCITWSSVRDTFWKNYVVEVKSSSNGNRAVTLDRVVTKLKVTVDDEVPSGCAHLLIKPETWYYGIDFVSGAPTAANDTAISMDVPANYIGTDGMLSGSVFSISGADEWSTDVVLSATDVNGEALGGASIDAAPMKRNRVTQYDGCLFSSPEDMDVSLVGDWDTPITGKW
jgi:hypothetical protein